MRTLQSHYAKLAKVVIQIYETQQSPISGISALGSTASKTQASLIAICESYISRFISKYESAEYEYSYITWKKSNASHFLKRKMQYSYVDMRLSLHTITFRD